MLVASDKTSNFYEVPKAEYNKLLLNEVTKTYKRSEVDQANNIDKKAKVIAESLGIENKVMQCKQAACYTTLKDHKSDFNVSPSVRLINPCNQDVSRVAQISLKKLIRRIKVKHNINLWENTSEALNWFTSKLD